MFCWPGSHNDFDAFFEVSVIKGRRIEPIILLGNVPSPIDPPSGCPFHPRCFAKVGKLCEEKYTPFFEIGEKKGACWIYRAT